MKHPPLFCSIEGIRTLLSTAGRKGSVLYINVPEKIKGEIIKLEDTEGADRLFVNA
jgi:hypothetical protein